MPTAYTSLIQEGINFENFVLTCSRAMGALIMIRDEPFDAPIPDKFEPSDYHKKELARAKRELEILASLSDEAKKDYCREYNVEQLAAWRKRAERSANLEAKYKEMLAKVLKWEPPTEHHEGLKKFMVDQIRSSIDFDCGMEYDKKPQFITIEEWYKMKVDRVERDIEYHTKEDMEEVERAEVRTEWVQQLKQSLNKDLAPK